MAIRSMQAIVLIINSVHEERFPSQENGAMTPSLSLPQFFFFFLKVL